VDIGASYTNERSGRMFVHYIAEAKWQMLVDNIANVKFYWTVLPMQEILIMKCYFCFGETLTDTITKFILECLISKWKSVTGEGLFELVQDTFKHLVCLMTNIKKCIVQQ